MLGGRPRVGGIFILLAVLRILSYSQISSLAGIFTVLEILTSTLIVVFAIVLYMRPSKHVPCGLSIVILSLIAGGMSALVPMVIGLVGGLLAIRRKGIPPTAVN
jgi:RsiW-degrading membrane proteinase PrsW (M82 family)